MADILITGGTGKVGMELIRSFIEEGHYVNFTSRSHSKALETIRSLSIPTDLVNPIEVDFSADNAVATIVQNLKNPLNLIIHNGRSIDYLKLDSRGRPSSDNFQNEFYMGVTFPYLLNNAVLDQNHPLKDIIFISSMYGIVGPSPSLYTDFENQSPINYGVTKAAQIHLTKELAIRLADREIRVNCISYGGIEGRTDDAFRARYAALSPMKKMLSNEDLYPPVKFIIDNPGLKMTGENIVIDGGWTLW